MSASREVSTSTECESYVTVLDIPLVSSESRNLLFRSSCDKSRLQDLLCEVQPCLPHYDTEKPIVYLIRLNDLALSCPVWSQTAVLQRPHGHSLLTPKPNQSSFLP